MASVRAAQTSVALAYAIAWPVPVVRSAKTTVAASYAITWPDPVVRSAQTTVAVLYDPSPPSGGGGASVSMLCQIIG